MPSKVNPISSSPLLLGFSPSAYKQRLISNLSVYFPNICSPLHFKKQIMPFIKASMHFVLGKLDLSKQNHFPQLCFPPITIKDKRLSESKPETFNDFLVSLESHRDKKCVSLKCFDHKSGINTTYNSLMQTVDASIKNWR